ncbi:MAG: hypothetical protein IPG76_05130 [Acidobacteria bacterium]|nr:hypothetical protein [Acidobacteriota bacterium]
MRNPMYAGTLIITGESLLFGSVNMLFHAYMLFLLFQYLHQFLLKILP